MLLGGEVGERIEDVGVIRAPRLVAQSFMAWATMLATDVSSLPPSLIVRWMDLKTSFGSADFILPSETTSLAQSSCND